MKLSDFEKKGMLQVLAYLYENKESSINEMGRNLEITVSTLRNTTLDDLKSLGLIQYRKVEAFPQPHLYSLTEFGKSISKYIHQLKTT